MEVFRPDQRGIRTVKEGTNGCDQNREILILALQVALQSLAGPIRSAGKVQQRSESSVGISRVHVQGRPRPLGEKLLPQMRFAHARFTYHRNGLTTPARIDPLQTLEEDVKIVRHGSSFVA
ncbi:hypothetical protein K7W42_21190 [Deinococcus sp. HMF7604]|uniref:hypothetical protein n=1 Tax=Deinococcus betulae TaxID=2873312 RepID=UPI001CC9C8EE|nr:hypothetical protein [Deinococcus betulae]MBZ9753353.1 hypothetical protein [Deinococcus betulae]